LALSSEEGILSLLIYLIQILGPDFWILFSLLAAVLIFVGEHVLYIYLPAYVQQAYSASGWRIEDRH
jgi:uncharacterized membrane protein AbrB (regulator of aidB expression)